MKIVVSSLLTALLFLIAATNTLATTSVNLSQITTDNAQQKDPLIYKESVAYTNYGGQQGIDIWLYDLEDEQHTPIVQKEGDQFLTGFSKNIIVYDDFDSTTQSYDVRMYNMKREEDKLVAGGSGTQSSGVTNGKEIVYIDGGACGSLHVFDIKKEISEQIYDTTCTPIKMWENIVVFQVADPNGTNIKGYNLRTKKLFDIATGEGFQEVPNIFENTVVWLHRDGNYNAIVMKNIRNNKEKAIYESSTDSLQYPSISNKYAVWSQSSGQHIGGVMGANLKTGEVFTVQEQGQHQNSHTTTSLWKNTAVWMAWRTGNGDIYGATLERE